VSASLHAGPRFPIQARHGLQIVIQHVGWRVRENVERRRQPTAEVGHQHLDPRARRTLADGIDAGGEMPRATVAQIVAIDTGDHDMTQRQQRDRVRQMRGFVDVRRLRPSMGDVAERATPRAQVAEDHEGCRAAAEALGDVGAGRFLAHGMQALFAQHPLHVVKPRAVRQAHTDPVRLRQCRGRLDLDHATRRQPRCLRIAALATRHAVHRVSHAGAGTAINLLPIGLHAWHRHRRPPPRSC